MLGAADYLVFVITLCLSAGIGLYFGCFGSKQKTATEYLYGKGTMKAIPVGLSLYSSAISAITIAGIPSEIYTFGTQLSMIYIGILLSLIIIWKFVLPVFCGDLKISTPYEYFELRFNYNVRLMATIIYIVHTLLYMPVVLYAATITFSEASEISLPICTTIIGGICIFYTLLGGFSAVIWSDTFQATLMFGSCIFVMVKGITSIGSFSEIFNRAEQGNRLTFFKMDPNPFQRLTFWSAVFGMCFNHSAHSGCSASSIQRYLSLKNVKQARISTAVGIVSATLLGIIVCMIGLTMYAQYYDCDPVKNQEVTSYNKLLSHYVGYIVKDVPGFFGLFNVGILCAGLSTLSAELNTVSGLIYHCFIKKLYKKPIDEFKGAVIMKIVVLINGLYYLLVAPSLEKSSHLLALALGITGITYGAKLGMLILGTSFPKCNSMGVACVAVAGILLIGWINFGAMYYDVNSNYVLPQSTENCIQNITEILNTTNSSIKNNNDVFIIYKLSYMYYSVVGTLITILVALFVSYFTKTNKQELDSNLFIPWVRPKKIPVCEEATMLHNFVNKEM